MGKHLDDVIVKAVVDHALEGPGKLRMFEVPRVKVHVVSVYRDNGILEVHDYLHTIAVLLGGELDQRVFEFFEQFAHALELHTVNPFRHG